MRAVSKTRQRVIRQSKAVREEFAAEFPQCMVCGREPCDTHEISRGPARGKSLGQRESLLRVCRRCHDAIHETWTLQQQYALKALADVEHYDRVALNRLRGRADDAIDEREVWRELRKVLRRVRIR